MAPTSGAWMIDGEESRMKGSRTQSVVAACAGAAVVVLLGAGAASAQTVFDSMKCFKIKDAASSKQFTADLEAKLTHDFTSQLGDQIVGGFLVKGCRVKAP